ncbi:MAG: flavin reductase [Actinobacteria bacterium]|uniref:Unannotated protein n=1 Tax=freshwater metagenome TaxID=449393 RepID=A0A6J7PQ01_9ZZZZ|nr:flavin reductase [Actinomycetota bacterium]
MTGIDDRRFREVLGHYPTGVALVAALAPEGDPVGMVVGSFTSVSLDPPLVAFLPAIGSGTFARLRQSGTFVINVLSAEQEGLCRTFASRSDDKWAGVDWHASASGDPILRDAVAWIECAVESITEAGDHYLVIGRVRDLSVQSPVTPLVFFQGGYGRFTQSSLVAASTPELIAAIRMAEAARGDIERLAARLGVACDVVAAVGGDLVFVGSAAAENADPSGSTLGTRIPLMAPLGEQYVAWCGPEAAEEWMSRAGITDSHERAVLRARLDSARERGWSMSDMAPEEELGLYDVLREYSDGEVSPAEQRDIHERIERWSIDDAPGTIEPEALYDVHSIAVPVLDADARPMLLLRVVSLPHPASGAQIEEWVAGLLQCAASIGAHIEELAR